MHNLHRGGGGEFAPGANNLHHLESRSKFALGPKSYNTVHMAKIHLGANCAHVHGFFHEYPRSMFKAEIGREGVLFHVLS